jgi:hypothetical protein
MYKKCHDFASKRQFLVDYIEQITYYNDKIIVHGAVPIKTGKQSENHEETSRLEFLING